jgi:2-polyprenyl-3-methyl-5-hydroxy-6-metoxy-1,4-benzoquinol methylase
MSENTVEDYGWHSPTQSYSNSYIEPRIKEILQRLQVKRVADLGTGNGAMCDALAKSGLQMVGIEYDKAGVELAKQSYPHINFYNFGVQDDPEQLLATEAPFDAVISTEVIEHLFSPHLLPTYARSILKPGGHLVVTTPYHGYVKNLALSVLNKWDQHHTALWHGGHIKFWSRKTLTALLEQNGFVVQEFSGVGRVAYLWKSMVLVAKKAS